MRLHDLDCSRREVTCINSELRVHLERRVHRVARTTAHLHAVHAPSHISATFSLHGACPATANYSAMLSPCHALTNLQQHMGSIQEVRELAIEVVPIFVELVSVPPVETVPVLCRVELIAVGCGLGYFVVTQPCFRIE